MPDLTIVIPTHNRREILRGTLERLGPKLPAQTEVLVFADGCTDGTEEMVKKEFGFARVASSATKLGPSIGRTRAFELCSSEFLLSIDDDSWPMDEGYSEIVFRHFSDAPDAGFLAASVYDGAHPDGAAPRETPPYFVKNFVGCGFAVRTKLFRDLGGFRSFFQYGGEEIEMAMRAHAAGWRVLFVPSLRIFHDKTMVNRREGEMIRSGLQNNLASCVLNEPAWICLPHLIRLAVKGVVHGLRQGFVAAPWLALGDFTARLPRLLPHRKPLSGSTILEWKRLPPCPPA